MKLSEEKLKELIEINPLDWAYVLINALEGNKSNSAALWYLEIVEYVMFLRNSDSNYEKRWRTHLDEIRSVVTGSQILSIEKLARSSKIIFNEFKDKNRVSLLLSHAYAFQINFINQEYVKYKKNMAFAAKWFIDEGPSIISVIKKKYDLQLENS